MVVNLAVEDDLKRAVFVGHGLVTGGNVNDAQAAMTQPDPILDEDARVVGTAMRDLVAHPLDDVALDAPAGSLG
jgi:hypothetical protein